MGKNPCFLFYPSDWERDVAQHPLEIGGAWMLILCSLFWEGGGATKTLPEWAKIIRENQKKTQEILEYLSQKSICDLDNQNGNITIISRRMMRDIEIREIRKIAGKKGGNPALKKETIDSGLLNQNTNQNVSKNQTPRARARSLSVSSSVSDKALKAEDERFTLPSKEEISESSNPKLLSSIENLSKHLYEGNIFPEVHAFKNLCLKNKANLRAVVHTLTRCAVAKPTTPWAYCVSIMQKEDGNFNARDYTKSKS